MKVATDVLCGCICVSTTFGRNSITWGGGGGGGGASYLELHNTQSSRLAREEQYTETESIA